MRYDHDDVVQKPSRSKVGRVLAGVPFSRMLAKMGVGRSLRRLRAHDSNHDPLANRIASESKLSNRAI